MQYQELTCQSLIGNPHVVNVVVAPDNERTCVRIQNYSDVNPVALRRVLTDPNLPANATLNQTFATFLLTLDPETRLFTLPENIISPVKVSNEPGKSRIWCDFTFPEIGHGDDFLNMESIVEKDPEDPQAMASGIAPPHPYLSVEKATRVNQWVVERAEMEVDDGEPEPEPQPDLSRDTALVPTKKTPGIRTRKAAMDTNTNANVNAKVPEPALQPEPTPETAKAELSTPGKTTPGPRKVWKMQYDSGVDNDQAKLLDQAKESDAASNSSTKVRPQTPEEKPRFPTFDPTKYGLNKSPQKTAKESFDNTASGEGEGVLSTPQRKPRSRDLVDLFAPAAPATAEKPVSHPLMSFDQPALVPQKSNSTANLASVGRTYSHDLFGLDVQGTAPTRDTSWQEKKLHALKEGLEPNKIIPASDASPAFSTRPVNRREVNMRLARQTLAQVERNIETMKKTNDETKTRQFRRTMNQKAGKPKPDSKASPKPLTKAEAKAKHQATLEDAWGIVKPASKKAATKPEEPVKSTKTELMRLALNDKKPNANANAEASTEKDEQHLSVSAIFEALRPALEAAEYFSGPLSFEVQLGLVLIPLVPKTYNSNSLINVREWTRIFQPRNGIPPPTTKFTNRLTTAGSDVDHIVDLKTSKGPDAKKHHLFEQDYTEYNVSYEFHCCTTANQPFTIAIDEQGKHALRKPTTTLGAVNLHFPRHIWDASVTLNGTVEHLPGSDPDLEDAVQYLVDNLWIQPDRSLIRIFSRLPKDNKFVIHKVLMKRYTRHRHVRLYPKHMNPDTTPDTTPDMPLDPEEDIFLQVLEVQDLLVGSSTSDTQALRARCASYPEMIKKNRLWYEVSVVSPAIEAFLKANANVEIGERTDDWRAADILGGHFDGDGDGGRDRDRDDNHDDSEDGLVSPVAMAIGSAGLDDLLRLTRTVVEKIDGIGFWNYGPGVEAVHFAAGGGAVGTTGDKNGPGPSADSALAQGPDPDAPAPAPGPGPAFASGADTPIVEQSASPEKQQEQELEYW